MCPYYVCLCGPIGHSRPLATFIKRDTLFVLCDSLAVICLVIATWYTSYIVGILELVLIIVWYFLATSFRVDNISNTQIYHFSAPLHIHILFVGRICSYSLSI